MFQPTRILAALVLAGAATAAQARAPMPMSMPMPAPMPAALSAPMPAPTLRIILGFRHVTALGTTKPAGAALDVRGGTKPSLDADSHRLDRLIRTAICTGC